VKARKVLPVVVGLLIVAFIFCGLLSTVVLYKAESAYAMGPNPGLTDFPRLNRHGTPVASVPEPSILVSLGAGVAGLGVYLYSRRTKKK
jgi:hypothetical protein